MRHSVLLPVIAMAAIFVGLVTTVPRAASAPGPLAPRTVSDGVYTSDQATRGEAAYGKDCAFCHSADLQGDSFAPPLVADPFRLRWKDGTVGDLFAVIKGTMPADRPSGLSDEEYSSIVAYLLKMNNYPAGQDALSKDVAELKQITFVKSEGQSQP